MVAQTRADDRDGATDIEPMRGKCAICCDGGGGILNDFVLLRPGDDEFWFSSADSDLLQRLQGVTVGNDFEVDVDEIDVSPMQVQGPKSPDVIESLIRSPTTRTRTTSAKPNWNARRKQSTMASFRSKSRSIPVLANRPRFTPGTVWRSERRFSEDTVLQNDGSY